MMDARLQLDEPETVPPLAGELVAANLSLAEDDGSRVVDAVSFSLPLDRARRDHRAGRQRQERAGACCLRGWCSRPAAGSRSAASISATLPVAVIGRRIGYVGATPYLFAGTLRDNLLLVAAPCAAAAGRVRRARKPAAGPGSSSRREDPAISISTSMPIGSITRLPASPIARRCRVASPRCSPHSISDSDVYSLGLRWRLDPESEPETAGATA